MQAAVATDLPMAIPPPSVFRAYRTRVKSKESPDIIISGDDQRQFSQSFDFANLRSERRNSFSTFFGLASRQRWNDSGRNVSVPNVLNRPNSAQTGSNGKHRGLKLYHYLNVKGASPDRDAGSAAIAPAYSPQAVETSLRLEDEFEKIKFQLAEMSQESGQFKQRIHSLSRAVNDLHNTISQQQYLEEDDEEEEGIEDEEEEDQLSDDCICENSLASPLRLFPPNGWGSVTSSVGDSNESIPHDSTQSDTNWLEASSCRQETDGFNGPLCVIRVEDADSETASEGDNDDFLSSVLRQFAQSS